MLLGTQKQVETGLFVLRVAIGAFMLIALANTDGSYTSTLFMPHDALVDVTRKSPADAAAPGPQVLQIEHSRALALAQAAPALEAARARAAEAVGQMADANRVEI